MPLKAGREPTINSLAFATVRLRLEDNPRLDKPAGAPSAHGDGIRRQASGCARLIRGQILPPCAIWLDQPNAPRRGLPRAWSNQESPHGALGQRAAWAGSVAATHRYVCPRISGCADPPLAGVDRGTSGGRPPWSPQFRCSFWWLQRRRIWPSSDAVGAGLEMVTDALTEFAC